MRHLKVRSAGLFLALSIVLPSVAQTQTNGIFADFTTSLGNFTCQLSYSNSPVAVANFIGLATGERPWLDLVTGQVRTNAFYDGLTFHRVVSGFVIQAGSPDGKGDDDPGYSFPDQFSPLLNFGAPWTLAMANSGPDSNGSQFFVTVEPFTSGNNTYVIFGRVVSGTNVVAAINSVKTDSADKPLTNVVIQHVAIRRVGDAAQAFDINTQNLPMVTNLPVNLLLGSNQVSLNFSNQINTDNRWYGSTNLSFWFAHSLGIETTTSTSNTVHAAMDAPQKFFRMAQIQYPSSTLTPKDVQGRTLRMVFANPAGTNTIVFNSSGGGTYNFPGVGSGSSGTVTSYTWSQEPYSHGRLWPISFSGLLQQTLILTFSTSTNGTFTGTVYSVPSFSVSGTFKLTGP
jgi:peptidyl-prolyl cis-trans isomerase A (cyclophilin A)